MKNILRTLALAAFTSLSLGTLRAADLNVSGNVNASAGVTAYSYFWSAGGYVSTGSYGYFGWYVQSPQGIFTNVLSTGGSVTNGYLSTALGLAATASSYSSLVVGRYNKQEGTAGSWVKAATEPLLVAGNGDDAAHPNNAFAVYKDGTVTMSKAQGDISMGQFGN